MKETTNIQVFIADLDGGLFMRKFSSAITGAALATLEHREKSVVKLEFKITPIGMGTQVNISHSVHYDQPTLHGNDTAKDTTETPMHVGRKGLTIFPEDQSQLFTKSGQPVINEAK